MAAAQSVAFLGIAISTEVSHDNGSRIPGIVATVFISLYFVAFGIGWTSVPWLYPAEINSLSMRTKGAALATAMDWLFNYLVVQTTPIGIHYLKWGLYLIFSILNACFVPVVYFLIVETAGKSLEQIDRWFAVNPGWLVHKTMNATPECFTWRIQGNGSPHVPLTLNREESDESEGMIKAHDQDVQHYDTTSD